MLSCLICSELVDPILINKGGKQAFLTFCKLVGVVEEEAEDFAQEYNFRSESPYCSNCRELSLELAKQAESREALTDEILQLQKSICDKPRDVSEFTDEIDKFLRQVRELIKNSAEIDEEEAEVRCPTLRKLVVQCAGAEEEKSRQSCPQRSQNTRQRRPRRKCTSKSTSELIERFPETFRIPENILSVTVAKVKDEPEDLELGAWPNLGSMLNENEMDFQSSLPSPEIEMDEEDVLEGDEPDEAVQSLWIVPGKPQSSKLSKRESWKNSTPKKSETKRKKMDCKYEESDSDFEFELTEDDNSEEFVDDEDCEEEKVRKMREQKERDFEYSYKDPVTFVPGTSSCIEFLGEIEVATDKSLSFKGIPIKKTKSGKMYECGKCGENIKRYSATGQLLAYASVTIRKHIQEKHFGGYECKLCDKGPYDKWRTYRKHELLHLKPKANCEICGKPYKHDGDELQLHKWSHMNQEEKAAALKSGLKPPVVYPIKKPVARNYQCATCGKRFIGKKALRIHDDVHKDKSEREKNKVPCPICGKLYTVGGLPSHQMYTHKKAIPRYPCEYCGKMFMGPARLDTHVRSVHTGERPFPCQICSKPFVSQASLSRHIMQL